MCPTHQFSSTAQEDVCNDGVPVGACIGEGTVPSVGLGVDISPLLDQVAHYVEVSFLGGLHEGGGGPQLNLTTCGQHQQMLYTYTATLILLAFMGGTHPHPSRKCCAVRNTNSQGFVNVGEGTMLDYTRLDNE